MASVNSIGNTLFDATNRLSLYLSFRSSLSLIIISSNLGFINHLNLTHRILNTSVNTFLSLSKSYLH